MDYERAVCTGQEVDCCAGEEVGERSEEAADDPDPSAGAVVYGGDRVGCNGGDWEHRW